jgi:hypothetical protein
MLSPEKRELRAIREILAVKENMMETGDFGNYTNLQVEVCVPEEYQYLKDYDKDALEKRQRRLRQDIADKVNLDVEDACEFDTEVNYRQGRRMEDEGEN